MPGVENKGWSKEVLFGLHDCPVLPGPLVRMEPDVEAVCALIQEGITDGVVGSPSSTMISDPRRADER